MVRALPVPITVPVPDPRILFAPTRLIPLLTVYPHPDPHILLKPGVHSNPPTR